MRVFSSQVLALMKDLSFVKVPFLFAGQQHRSFLIKPCTDTHRVTVRMANVALVHTPRHVGRRPERKKSKLHGVCI
jgi:hypothetical protein